MALNFAKAEFVRSPDGGRISFGTVCTSSHLQAGPMWEKVLSSTGLVGRKNLAYVGASPGKTTQVELLPH